ncbi:MAG TPA: hypothetical protein VGA99_04500, partial [bacterium]
FFSYTGKIGQKDLDISVPAGTFENCIMVFHDIPQYADDEKLTIFARGVGPIEMTTFRMVFRLESAVVNGVRYGRGEVH